MLFRRRAVGPDGDFDAFKLRAMRVEANRWVQEHPELLEQFRKKFKLREERRVTRFEKFLR